MVSQKRDVALSAAGGLGESLHGSREPVAQEGDRMGGLSF